MTGSRYLESLNDGREVWLDGQRVEDVTKRCQPSPAWCMN